MQNEERGLDLNLEGGSVGLKRMGVVLGLVFTITLAVMIGKQMSAEAMAVVVGIVCGVAAGIPTAVLLLVVLTRRDHHKLEKMERQTGQSAYPPVVVIQGGAPQALPPGSQAGYWPAPQPGPSAQRQFHVVGGEEWVLDDGRY